MTRKKWASDLHWVRPGQQTRSQRTQQALLDAAEALFAEQGVDATSVAEVAERAGTSIGAVYHHFRDKKALLYALYDRLAESFQATTAEAVDPARWVGASVGDILQGYLEFALQSERERPGFKRVGLEASRLDPALGEHFDELKADLGRGLTDLILARADEIGHPDPKLATAFVLDQTSAMLRSRLHGSTAGTQLGRRSDRVFVAETLRSLCAYLQIERPG